MELHDEFAPYADLIEEGMIPDMGFRILTFVTSKGQRGYKWYGTGDFDIEQIVALLERVKFLMQFRTEIEDMMPGALMMFGLLPVEEPDEDH